LPEIFEDDILLFGSIYSLNTDIRETLLKIIDIARKNKAIIVYDPNFRKNHASMLAELMPLLVDNFLSANIIRGSDDDFKFIFRTKDVQSSFDQLFNNELILVYTANKNGVFVKSDNLSLSVEVKKIDPISTIGAGDTFNAGLIFGLLKHNIRFEDLKNIERNIWLDIINTAIEFATEVCLSYENYISEEFAERVLNV
jgi:fructokinase